MEILKILDDNKAGIALFFSLASFYFSARTAWLDRAKIVIKARPYVYDRGDGKTFNHLEFFIYNHGRREAAIDRIVYNYSEGYSIYHGGVDEQIALKENQRKIIKVDYNDLLINGTEGDIYFLEDIVIVDVRGKEYTIPNCKAMIDKLHESHNSI